MMGSLPAGAQDVTAPLEPSEVPRPAKKKPAVKKKTGEKGGELGIEKNLKPEPETPVPAAGDSVYLPDWPSPSFGLNLRPVVGYGLATEKSAGKTLTRAEYELGLEGGVSGIPLVPGNFGVFASPKVGYAYAGIDLRVDGSKLLSANYNRAWIGNDIAVLLRWFRYTLGLEYGRVFGSDDVPTTQSLIVKNDFGVLVLPFLSAHLTHTYGRLYGERYMDYFESYHDDWLHLLFSTSIMSFYVDFGPGVTMASTRESDSFGNTSKISQTVTYFKALTGFHIFWKLGMSGSANYSLDATEPQSRDVTVFRRNPSQDLAAVSKSPLFEKDMFQGRIFLGLSRLFGGLGVGWIYNVNVRHAFERDGEKSESSSHQGFGLSYEASF
jgi:hypothetical protein